MGANELPLPEAVRRKLALFEKVQKIARIGGWELDLSTDVLTWTEETYRIHGVTPSHFTPTVAAAVEFYIPSARPHIRRALRSAMRDAIQYDLELQIVRCDGERRWVRALGRRADDEGHPELVCGVIQDITERRELEEEIVGIAQREQLRLGFDLHDGLGQELTGASLILKSVVSALPSSAGAFRDNLESVESLIRDAISTCRSVAEGLSPTGRERGGLIGAVRQLAARIEKLHSVEVRVRIRGDRWTLSDQIADHLYRITQEAVTNALQHGSAQLITIALEANATRTLVSITNDQHGTTGTNRDGMGLKIMQYRARLIGGALTIRKRPTGGMRVRCCVTTS